MDIVKICGIAIISTVVIMLIKQYKPEFTVYISILAGAIILSIVIDKLFSIVTLLTTLSNKTGMNTPYLNILLKITGIAIISEFTVSVCKDLGETAIASKVDFASKIIIVSISIPIITALLELIIKILP